MSFPSDVGTDRSVSFSFLVPHYCYFGGALWGGGRYRLRARVNDASTERKPVSQRAPPNQRACPLHILFAFVKNYGKEKNRTVGRI